MMSEYFTIFKKTMQIKRNTALTVPLGSGRLPCWPISRTCRDIVTAAWFPACRWFQWLLRPWWNPIFSKGVWKITSSSNSAYFQVMIYKVTKLQNNHLWAFSRRFLRLHKTPSPWLQVQGGHFSSGTPIQPTGDWYTKNTFDKTEAINKKTSKFQT